MHVFSKAVTRCTSLAAVYFERKHRKACKVKFSRGVPVWFFCSVYVGNQQMLEVHRNMATQIVWTDDKRVQKQRTTCSKHSTKNVTIRTEEKNHMQQTQYEERDYTYRRKEPHAANTVRRTWLYWNPHYHVTSNSHMETASPQYMSIHGQETPYFGLQALKRQRLGRLSCICFALVPPGKDAKRKWHTRSVKKNMS